MGVTYPREIETKTSARNMDTIAMFLFAFLLLFHQVVAEYAVLKASTSSQNKHFCVWYNPDWKELPTDISDTPAYKYVVVPRDILCGQNKSEDYADKTVFCQRDRRDVQCTFLEQHEHAQQRNASALVVVNSDDTLFIAVTANYTNSTIPLAVMGKSDFYTMKNLDKQVLVQLYAPPLAAVDFNLAVIWFLAVGTVVIGAYWSGVTASKQRETLVERKSMSNNGKSPESADDEDPAMQITPLMVVIFVALICGFLLLVYYFYKYVIYAIIAVFALASFSGTYECLNALLLKLPLCQCRLPPNSIPILKSEPFVKSLFVFCFSLALVIWWVIVRNASYGWILQDILGVLFCVSLLKNLRLPSMKICTLLLVLLLIYDVFFVFITPLFSASHKSVMVDVATGEGNKEQLPMVIKVPRILRSAILVCQRDYSLLGFGDILVPGLFVSFCHSYDQMAKTPYRLYYVASSVAYGCGLIITFAALFLMKEGQPALVYLVPCTLGTVIVISLIRKEFCNLWHGTYLTGASLINDDTSAPLTDEEEEELVLGENDLRGPGRDTDNNDSRAGEQERLIN